MLPVLLAYDLADATSSPRAVYGVEPMKTGVRAAAMKIARSNVRRYGKACLRCDATVWDLCHHLLRDAATQPNLEATESP